MLLTMVDWKDKNTYLRPGIPVFVVCYMAFSEWAYSYLLCYQHIYQKWAEKHTMLALIITANVFWLATLVFWVATYLVGPGQMPLKVPAYDLERYVQNGEKTLVTDFSLSSTEEKGLSGQESSLSAKTIASTTTNGLIKAPEIFECDRNGLPFWCSECETLKVLRAHHSSTTNKCCVLFDHYCTFIGSPVGKKNYGFFFLFVVFMQLLLMFTWFSCLVMMRIKHLKHGALITFMTITGIFLILVSNVLYNMVSDVVNGETRIERLSKDRWRAYARKNTENYNEQLYNTYINIQHPSVPSLRLVVALKPQDTPYKRDFKQNLKLWFTDLSTINTPQKLSDFSYSLFSSNFKKEILNRINDGDFIVFGSLKNILPDS